MSIDSGSWGDGITWELYPTADMPPTELCTAVFCLAFTGDNKIVLMRAARGWGLLGGHIEEGETVFDALIRESQEEGGFTPHNPQLFAYRKITSDRAVPHQDPARTYPFPHSYILFYWATTLEPLAHPTGLEVLEHGVFDLQEALLRSETSRSIIELGYGRFLRHT